VCFVCMC